MKKIMGVLTITVVFMISGCSFLNLFATIGAQNTHITATGYEGVIFTGANAAQAGIGYEFNEKIGVYWTPSEKEIDALEAGLPDFLRSTIAPDQYGYRILDELDSYKRQYFGITFADGEPLIYTNFFCADQFDYWLESPVFVMDGGECFFQVLYNLATRSFSDLRINGYA